MLSLLRGKEVDDGEFVIVIAASCLESNNKTKKEKCRAREDGMIVSYKTRNTPNILSKIKIRHTEKEKQKPQNQKKTQKTLDTLALCC